MSVKDAANEYRARQNRDSHPSGIFDRASRWYPDSCEEQSCCKGVRDPSRRFPLSLNKHCRSIEHVANLYGVSETELRKAVGVSRGPVQKSIKYKKVAIDPDGDLVSVYDGTVYEIGKTLRQACRPDHNGGWYVYETAKDADTAKFPNDSRHLDLFLSGDTALLRCEVWGRCESYASGESAWTYCKPIDVVSPTNILPKPLADRERTINQMKGYIVYAKGMRSEAADLVFGKSATHAKRLSRKYGDATKKCDWIDIRVNRLPNADSLFKPEEWRGTPFISNGYVEDRVRVRRLAGLPGLSG